MVSSGFWQGKRVFLTGHTGFKGAWLTALLLRDGAIVTGYALPPPTNPALFGLLNLKSRIAHIEGDVRDRAKLAAALAAAQPEIVFHLAAQALVRASYEDPLGTFDTNTTGTLNLLEALRSCKSVRSIVVVTSDKCYLNNETGAFFREDDPLGGKDPYSASKAAAEIVAQAYHESFFKPAGIPLATARAGNVIGGGDWAKDRLIPDVARAHAAGEPVLIRSPNATRPWQHVLEPLRGYMMLAEQLVSEGQAFTGGWNFGPRPEDIRSVGDVLSKLKETLPFELRLDSSPQPAEAKTLGLDIRKSMEKLGWQPRLALDEAIRWTGEWYNT
ncbi:MAG: CDP-glucose 4,6-dehydratase, partial [Alphaproteobacteria bacterium]|nr:CDP-glucose 4,6-dehydratase [Alphaproteobacteria bacterium]